MLLEDHRRPAHERPRSGSHWYNAVWRWHFYTGLFCIPFVIWLALTGTIYLWRPQLEALLDRPYDDLPTTGSVASPDAQVGAALRAVPGSTLHRYVLPEADGQAVRVLVTAQGEDKRTHDRFRSCTSPPRMIGRLPSSCVSTDSC